MMNDTPMNQTRRALRWAVVLTVVVLVDTPTSTAQRGMYTRSIQAATGDYLFTEQTSSVYFNNSVALTSGRLRVSVGVPIIAQSTPWVTCSSGFIT